MKTINAIYSGVSKPLHEPMRLHFKSCNGRYYSMPFSVTGLSKGDPVSLSVNGSKATEFTTNS